MGYKRAFSAFFKDIIYKERENGLQKIKNVNVTGTSNEKGHFRIAFSLPIKVSLGAQPFI